jgi:hypothetical protein
MHEIKRSWKKKLERESEKQNKRIQSVVVTGSGNTT